MKRNKLSVLGLFLFFINTAGANEQAFCSKHCTFVLMSESTGSLQVIKEQRANKRFSPFSTFKIPNSLIALDLGIVKNLDQLLSFDQEKYPVQSRWPERWFANPLDLRQAFKYSAVPIYQQLASKFNRVRMKSYVNRFDYGNRDVSSGVDTFWLGGSLEISAKEQVIFMQKMVNNDFSVSERALSLLKQIMLVEEADGYQLYAKTGGGRLGKESVLGWYVGFVENKTGTHYFALISRP